MQEEPEEVIAQELVPGEDLLWAGRAHRGLFCESTDWVVAILGLMICAFAVYWDVTAILAGAPLPMLVFGALIFVSLFYLSFGRFLLEAWERSRASYGVTTERVIIVSKSFRRSVTSLNLDTITDLSLTERRGGAGTITFLPPSFTDRMFYHYRVSALAMPKFELPDEANKTFDLIRSAQWNASNAARSRP
jgi:hypothetical protein